MSGKPVVTRHEHVRRALIRLLQDHDVGDKLPSDRALASNLGVAYLTVNRAMRELAWEGYVERKPRRGTFLASREKAVHSDLSTGTRRGECVAFAYPNYFSFSYWIRLRCAEEQAVKRGLGLVEFRMNSDTSYGNLRQLLKGREDLRGVLVMPVPSSIDRSTLDLLDGLGVPVVVLAPIEMVSATRRVWSVTADWYVTGYMMVESLVRAGHERIAYLHNEPDALEWQLTLRGARRAMRDAGFRWRDLAVARGGLRPWEDCRKEACRLAAQVLASSRPTGLAVDSFSGALGVLRALWERGIRVPEEASLVSHGPSGGMEDYSTPPLTTVDTPPGEEMRLAFECIQGRAESSPRALTVPPVLSSRRSIATPPTGLRRDEGVPATSGRASAARAGGRERRSGSSTRSSSSV